MNVKEINQEQREAFSKARGVTTISAGKGERTNQILIRSNEQQQPVS
jgi:hypothetical protein